MTERINLIKNFGDVKLRELQGTVVVNIKGLEEQSGEVTIFVETNNKDILKGYTFYHYQDCCETVYLSDFELDTPLGKDSLIGEKITKVEEVHGEYVETKYGDAKWTFYRIHTSNGGTLFMRWLGESNGYYGIEVSLKVGVYSND